MKKTGNKRYRAGWFGRVILQIEWTYYHPGSGEDVCVWRDARPEDVMTEPKP